MSRRSEQLCKHELLWLKNEKGLWVQNSKEIPLQCQHSRAQHKRKQYWEKAIPRKGFRAIPRIVEYCTACTIRNKHHEFVNETGAKNTYVLQGLFPGEIPTVTKLRNKPSKHELQKWERAERQHEERLQQQLRKCTQTLA
jgi:hypothetical protein